VGKGKKKQKKPKIPKPNISATIQAPSLNQIEIPYRSSKPVFSFEFYDIKHAKYTAYSFTNCSDLCLVFKHLKRLSSMTWEQIESGKNRAHEVTWAITKEKKGFPQRLGNKPSLFPPYSFQLFGRVRVYGFHCERTFNIVWFDTNHEIHPDG